MDTNLLQYLESLRINYRIYQHPAVFTVAEAEKIDQNIPALHTKNLFLKSQSNYYLICLQANKRLDIKNVSKILGIKKLSFASPEELKLELQLTPGSVSIFGIIYAKKVELILDKDIVEAEKVGFHPNINTATLVVDKENFKIFLNSLNEVKISTLTI